MRHCRCRWSWEVSLPRASDLTKHGPSNRFCLRHSQLHKASSIRDFAAAHLKVSSGVARTLAPALVRVKLQLAFAAACLSDLTAGRSFPRPQHHLDPPRLRAHTTHTTMSGAVATARPTQALRARRESQRPGIARVVTKTINMEEDSAKPEPKLYGMRHPTWLLLANPRLT